MGNIGYDILMWALGIIGTAITTVLLPMLVKYIQTKIKNEKLNYLLSEIGNAVITSVDYTQQTFVEQLKKDGKFDAEAQKEAMQRALDYTINTLSKTAKKIVEDENIDIYKLLEKYIESTVFQSK